MRLGFSFRKFDDSWYIPKSNLYKFSWMSEIMRYTIAIQSFDISVYTSHARDRLYHPRHSLDILRFSLEFSSTALWSFWEAGAFFLFRWHLTWLPPPASSHTRYPIMQIRLVARETACHPEKKIQENKSSR